MCSPLIHHAPESDTDGTVSAEHAHVISLWIHDRMHPNQELNVMSNLVYEPDEDKWPTCDQMNFICSSSACPYPAYSL